MRKFFLIVILMIISFWSYADIRNTENTYFLSIRGMPWELRFPEGGFMELKEARRESSSICYYMFADLEIGMNVSFFIEPAEKCKTSSDCRNLYWSNPGPGVTAYNPTEVEMFEENGFAIVKYVIKEMNKIKVDWMNYSSHIVRDGYWVDMHISKMGSNDKDKKLFSNFIKSVTFIPRSILPIDAQSSERIPSDGCYPIGTPDQGCFKVQIPQGWKVRFLKESPDEAYFTIELAPAEGRNFNVLITMFPVRDKMIPGKFVEETAKKALEFSKPQAVEKDIQLVEFKGVSGVGYYFSSTDKDPKPGEFKNLAQGALNIDKMAIIFTILTNDNREEIVNNVLTMLKESYHRKEGPKKDIRI